MILKVSVLVAAILQVVTPAVFSVGTFEEAMRLFPIYIQPAGWAFSVWGLIYLLSFVYAIYQIIPKNDNALLRKTRVPALLGFVGSIAWLFFSSSDSWLIWLTIPTLVLIAFFFTVIVRATADVSRIQNFFSRVILFPYAAWTGVAFWINVQAVPLEEDLIISNVENLLISTVLLVGILMFTGFYFYKSGFSLWYGGVLLWASAGVMVANIYEYENLFFASVAALYGGTIIVLLVRQYLKTKSLIS